jgi:hypothetical protein
MPRALTDFRIVPVMQNYLAGERWVDRHLEVVPLGWNHPDS